ncbi:MAG: Alpha/beta hydrolase fold protein [Nocardioides sp.]|nr:Alpha/beta hydrolase fold protein [Nocardioides sp.]
MSTRQVSWSLLVGALLCLVPVIGGVVLLRYDGGAALGWAMIGFFGAGVVVLGRKAISGG